MAMISLNVPLPDVLHEVDGEIVVRGHRITLFHVMSAHLERGISPEGMVFYYPTLSYDEVREVFAFYHANREWVEEYARTYRAELTEQEARYDQSPQAEQMRRRYQEMKEKMAALRAPRAEAG